MLSRYFTGHVRRGLSDAPVRGLGVAASAIAWAAVLYDRRDGNLRDTRLSRDNLLCWICGERPADSAEPQVKASDNRSIAPSLSQRTPAFLQINHEATNQRIGSATADALKFARSVCSHCNNAGTQVYDEAWRRLSSYLHANWREITARG